MPRHRINVIIIFLCVLRAEPARAQFGATAEVEQPLASTNREDATASGGEIDLRERVAAGETMADVLPEIPGTRVALFGAPGSFTGVSLRGADFDHTALFLGDLPLSNRDTGAFDFSVIPLSLFERVEIYRGGAPAWFGNGAIGGVVRLIPRANPSSSIGGAAQAGSFGTFGGEAHGSAVTRKVNAFHDLNFFSTQGDLKFVDDRGTRFDPSDDVERRLPNAEQNILTGISHLQITTRAGLVELVTLGTWKAGGQPGPASNPAVHTERSRSQIFGAIGWTRNGVLGRYDKTYRLQVMGGAGFARDLLDDPQGELGFGIPTKSDDRTGTAYGRVATSIDVSAHLQWTLVGTAQYDHFRPKDRISQLPLSSRAETALTLEPRIHGRLGRVRLELRPSIRFGFSQTEVHDNVGSGRLDSKDNAFLPTLRVAAAAGPLPWLTFSASVFTGTNLATILQLFGDRALVAGNPALKPERSVGGDLSLVARGESQHLAGSFEVRYFHKSIDDLIVAVRTSQFQTSFQNVEHAKIHGVEIGSQAELTPHLVSVLAVTQLRTRNRFDRELPFRSPLTALARLEGHTRELGKVLSDLVVYAEVQHTASGYVDAANLVPFPKRTPLELGTQALLLKRALSFAFTVRDVADARGFDFLGFPLPGRSFSVLVSYTKELGS